MKFFRRRDNIEKEIKSDKDAYIAILRNTLDDLCGQNRFMKRVCVMLLCLVVGLIVSIVGLNVYNEHKILKFLKEYDVTITSEITTDNDSESNGAISVAR